MRLFSLEAFPRGRVLAYAQAATRQETIARPRSAKSRSGVPGGSQTGIADFLGNFTTISAPSSQVLGLARETNCSLTLLTGNYTLASGLTYTRTGITANYDRVLHSEVGLTTKAGATYPKGCAAPATGIGSRPGVFAGPTKNWDQRIEKCDGIGILLCLDE